MNKVLLLLSAALLSTVGLARAQSDSSIVMLDQTNNPVSDMEAGDYEYAFQFSDNSYIGLRRSTQELEYITNIAAYTFRSRYAMRSLVDTGMKEDIVEVPAFDVVGSSGVGFAGGITTGVQGDFTALGFTKSKFSPMDYNDRSYLDNMVWFKTYPLPNIGSSIRLGLAGLYSTPLTRLGNATANAGGFVAIAHDLGGGCLTNADCYSPFGEPRFASIENGQHYWYPSHSVDTGWVGSLTVPALDLFNPFKYGTKKILITVPATTIKLRRRTIKHPTTPAMFTRSCLGMIEERRQMYSDVSDSEVEKVMSGAAASPGLYGTMAVYARCTATAGSVSTAITSPSLGGDGSTRRRSTTRPLTDPFIFCGDNIDNLECGIFNSAHFYQASTDLRSLSYQWNGKFYLVDTVTSTPRASIAVPDNVTPVKFFGYVGNI